MESSERNRKETLNFRDLDRFDTWYYETKTFKSDGWATDLMGCQFSLASQGMNYAQENHQLKTNVKEKVKGEKRENLDDHVHIS